MNDAASRQLGWRGGPAGISQQETQELMQAAIQVICEIGIEVLNSDYRDAILRQTGKLQGKRISFSCDDVEKYLKRWRERNAMPEFDMESENNSPVEQQVKLSLSVMPYSHTWLDPETGKHVPLTANRLAIAAKLLDTFAAEGIHATVPGFPMDVPGVLQPLIQYKTSAQWSRCGGEVGWLGIPRWAEYILAMAEVMQRPIQSTVVYVYSPLRFGGEELDTAIALKPYFNSLHVGTMGSCGGSLPLLPKAALTLSWAETIAGAMCLEILTGLPTNWGGTIEPFDLRAMTIPFGAPEQVLYYRLGREAIAHLRGSSPAGGHVPLLTMAKTPGAQSMLEKGMHGAFGTCSGCTSLGAAGSLSADEVFSPVQLVLDIELRDWLQRAVQDIEIAGDEPQNAFAAIREGLDKGCFTGADTTLDRYQEVNWFPRYLCRDMLGTWIKQGCPEILEQARANVLERMHRPAWQLPEPQFSQLEEIYESACKELGKLNYIE